MLKKIISEIIWITLFIIGLPFFIVDFLHRNKCCEYVIDNINNAMFSVNWWGYK